jgi:4-amino-4-deoxy-L-arabinose transferase-like glycosyltransferase
LLATLWLLAVGARLGWAVSLGRVVFPWTLAVTATWGFLWLRTQLRTRRWLVPLLLALSLAVRLIGADHEVSGRYWGDEGTYYQHATQINEGKLLTRSFVYPHLTYDLYAFALWLAGLFPGFTAGIVRALWGVTVPLEREWLILRLVSALLGAFTIVPVVLLARRIAAKAAALKPDLGKWAGAFAGLLLIANPHFNMGSHLFICDAPSAFFAAVSLAFAGRLLDSERNRDYAAAGIWAGLAAAAKYPAGVVAVAIVALWASWRFVRFDERGAKPRRWSWGLLWAGFP